MGPETRFKIRIRPQLERLSSSWWVKIQQVGLVGTPDFFGVVGGWAVVLELKAGPKARITKLQTYNLGRINKAGGFGLVAYPENWQAVITFLTALSKGEDFESLLRAIA